MKIHHLDQTNMVIPHQIQHIELDLIMMKKKMIHPDMTIIKHMINLRMVHLHHSLHHLLNLELNHNHLIQMLVLKVDTD